MELQTLTFLVVGLTFILYIAIAFWSRARNTSEFYVAGKHVHPIANGMATAADWMSVETVYVGRAVLLALFGVVAAFVAWQIRVRVSNLAATREEKDRIRQTFGQHVSPEVVDRLLEQEKPDGELRHVCIMFLDIRNFTTFSERRSPEEVVRVLNELFSFMIEAINGNHGIINKFLGDGFMAVFGAPVSSGEDCRNAVQAAREIIDGLDEFNGRRPTGLDVGIGLHAGDALTGEIGSRRRKEYTVIGDVVNVASRIESLNKALSTRVLVSDEVRRAVADDRPTMEDMGPQRVKGRSEPVPVSRLV